MAVSLHSGRRSGDSEWWRLAIEAEPADLGRLMVTAPDNRRVETTRSIKTVR